VLDNRQGVNRPIFRGSTAVLGEDKGGECSPTGEPKQTGAEER